MSTETKIFSSHIDKDLVKKIDEYSKEEGRTKKWVIETALKDFFKKEEEKKRLLS